MKILEIFKNPYGKFSLGRIAFVIFFLPWMIIYFYRWIKLKYGENTIPASVLTLFGMLLGYNFGKKLKWIKGGDTS